MPVFINDNHKDHFINIELLKTRGESILLILEHENHELSVLFSEDKNIVEYFQIRNPMSHVVCIHTKIGLIAYEENLGALAHGIHYQR